jgi:putative protease
MAKKKAKSKKKPKGKKKVTRKVAKKAVKKVGGKAKKAARKPAARAAGAPKRKPSAPARSAKTPKPGVAALPAEKQVVGGVLLGQVEDYFAHVNVMALKLLAPVSVGDMIRIKGHTTDITQKVESMQIEHQPVYTASTGDSVGIKIADRARRTDVVYKI